MTIIGLEHEKEKANKKEGLASNTTTPTSTKKTNVITPTSTKNTNAVTPTPTKNTNAVTPTPTKNTNASITTTAKGSTTTAKGSTTTAKGSTTTAKGSTTTTVSNVTTTAGDPSAAALKILQDVFDGKPYSNKDVLAYFELYRSSNPSKLLAASKTPIKLPEPLKSIDTFQNEINILVGDMITAIVKNQKANVSKYTNTYTAYLLYISDQLSKVDLKNPNNITALQTMFKNTIFEFNDTSITPNRRFTVNFDVLITYVNAMLSFLINSGLFNPTDTPEMMVNFNNLSVAQYGYIQTGTRSIYNILTLLLQNQIPVDICNKLSPGQPPIILKIQTFNNMDTKLSK